MAAVTAQDTYEEFRRNFEYSEGEEELKPWALLTPQEKHSWEEQWKLYTGEADKTDNVPHGDPQITQRRRPIA